MTIKNVCVFASSSQKLNPLYYNEAQQLGILIGQNGMNIVYGGSRLGMMFACAQAVKNNGGDIIGIMPQKLYDFGVGNPEDCDEFYITSGMRERKAKMDEMSDAVIALAGGFGTLEELSEIIVQKQLGYSAKPIVILNTNGFYNELIKFFDSMISEDFANSNAKTLYYVAETPQAAIDYLNSYQPVLNEVGAKF